MISKQKLLDLIIVTAIPLVILLLVFMAGLKISYLESLILVFGIPAAYLSIRSMKKVRKIAIFSLLASIPVAVIVELIAYWDHAWVVTQSVFPVRLFGFSPIENYIWQFLTVYLIIIFYEHFCKTSFQPTISKRIVIMASFLYSLMAVLIVAFYFESSLLHISYPYIWFCVPFFIIPVVSFLWKYPRFFSGFLKVHLYFLYIHMIFESIGVKLGHWTYPSSHYIGWVTFLGQRFPLEELVFVMLIGAFAACTYYEYFTNDDLFLHN